MHKVEGPGVHDSRKDMRDLVQTWQEGRDEDFSVSRGLSEGLREQQPKHFAEDNVAVLYTAM